MVRQKNNRSELKTSDKAYDQNKSTLITDTVRTYALRARANWEFVDSI